MPRVILFVLDSVGIGGAPDADRFFNGGTSDEGANTLLHIAEACAEDRVPERSGPLRLPHLSGMGLGGACALACGVRPPGLGRAEGGIWGVAEEASPGKDTITGHWELAGVPLTRDWGYFPRTVPTFPATLEEEIVKRGELPGILGDRHASGTEILVELGEESVKTGKPILYTSADSVLQIAAHEEAFGLERLYDLCRIARELVDPLNIGRVIARPFVGETADDFRRTVNRKDFSTPPPEPTLCDRVIAAGGRTIGIGKISDIFAGQGISENRKGPDDMALVDEALDAMTDARDGDLLFANFVEFDSLYGHRRNIGGYAGALEAFDARLPEVFAAMRPDDLLIVTADHGNDPSWAGTDHTRERTPLLCRGERLVPGTVGLRRFADVAETAALALGLPPGAHGAPFLERDADGRLRSVDG